MAKENEIAKAAVNAAVCIPKLLGIELAEKVSEQELIDRGSCVERPDPSHRPWCYWLTSLRFRLFA